jgi:V/A-type H+-transporting ATPase subunit E
MTPDDNFDRLSKEIFALAESETGQILAAAKEKGDLIRKKAHQDAEDVKSQLLDQAKREADRLRSQAVATTQLKARTMLLEAREKLFSQVFESAEEKLVSVQQWNDYEATVRKLILEAAMQLESKSIKIRADKFTAALITEKMLSEIGKEFGGKISLAEPLEKGTGIIASTEDGHLTFDNTLETRLAHLESELRAPVYHVLMGETL